VVPSPSVAGASLEGGSIVLHELDSRYVPGAALRSADGQLVWSAGDPTSSQIWRYRPGSPEPERVFTSPRDDGTITAIEAAASGYAFVEVSPKAFGDGGWRVWFLTGPGEEPVELGRGQAKGAGYAPTIAMDERRVVWAGFDEPASGAVSRLSMASTVPPAAAETLVELPVRDGLLWFPALNGDELWYGVIKGDFDATGVGDELHLETLDLADPDSPAVEFSGVGNDFNPAVSPDFVAWKSTAPGDSALTWGTLHVLDRRTQLQATVPVPMANGPSIGERFLAFDEITHARLELYDLRTGALLDLRRPGLPDTVHFGGQSVSGRLFAFFTQRGGDPPSIGWATLPG
jgi:hypothetical protein